MTSRERLLRVFGGEAPDRTPITLFVTDSDIEDGPPDCVLGQRTKDGLNDLIRFHEILGIDIMLRVGVDVLEPIAFDRDTSEWENLWTLSEGDKRLVHTIITPKGRLEEAFNLEGETFHGDYSKSWEKLRNVRTEFLVKTREDLELVKEFRPSIPVFDFSGVARASERLGDNGIVLPRGSSSVFNYAAGLMATQDILLKPLIEADFYADLMSFCLEDVIQVGQQVARAGGDVVRVVGNIANSGLVSPGFYSEHVFPYEKSYVDALASVGGLVLFHNCGQCFSLLGVYGEMLDRHALESLSTPRTGGDIVDLRLARDALGHSVTMVGNFDQIFLLREGTPGEIREEVLKIRDQTQGDDRFVFSTSDSIVPGTPGENIRALVDAAVEAFT